MRWGRGRGDMDRHQKHQLLLKGINSNGVINRAANKIAHALRFLLLLETALPAGGFYPQKCAAGAAISGRQYTEACFLGDGYLGLSRKR